MKNKICLITGANSGIGKYTALELARQGAHVVMLCRNEKKAELARQELINKSGNPHIDILLADLARQQDIHQAAGQFKANFEALDVLINNAGIVPNERHETSEGIERTFAINHLGPFLLTNLLMGPLKKAATARVVTVSSEVHKLGAQVFDFDNLQLKTGYSPYKAYGISKLCNIMFTCELAKRTAEDDITANCLHPGVVGTRLADEAGWFLKLIYTVGKPFMRSPARGARTSLWLATSDEVENMSGMYFKNEKVTSPSSIALKDDYTRALWEKSEALTNIN